MNKQEVIERLNNKLGETFAFQRSFEPLTWGHMECESKATAYMTAINYVEQLDEPQKVKVPAYVAEWFETNKYVLDRAILDYMFEDYASDNSEFGKWFDNKNGKPIETLVRMLDGYDVEEETKYEVIIADRYLVKLFNDGRTDHRFVCRAELESWHSSAYKLTEQEIKSIDERYWPFAVPVEKV